MTRTTEQDIRLEILNSLLTTPHRSLGKIWSIHESVIQQDPIFYVKLAAWYSDDRNGTIRDHKEAFCAALCLSNFEGHRDVGLALLREMPPYQVGRVVDWIHGRTTTKKVVDKKAKKKVVVGTEEKPEIKTIVEKHGLFCNVPRSVTTEVSRYLKEREADNDWFDSSVLSARKHLKRLYALLHIPPGERAQKILFEDQPPEGSKLQMLKDLHKASTPADQARIILEQKIPYRIASTVVSAMTPTVLLALIEVMSDQEVINNLGSLKKRGAFDNPDLKSLIEKKLEKAKSGKRVSALKGKVAKEVSGVSEEIKQQLDAIGDSQLKAKGRIKRPTALLVDASGSMSQAIELGKQIGSMISTVMDAPLYVYAFNTLAYPIRSEGKTLADWEKAFKGINATGGTACGVALENMIRNKEVVEQILIVTDEGDNSTPMFYPSLIKYKETFKIDPNICIVKVQNSVTLLEDQAKAQGISVDTWQFSGGSNYMSLPGLIPLLTRKSKLELLQDIMSWPLPQRKSA